MQFGPDLIAGAERQQADRLPAEAERKHEQAGAPVLAGLRIAHHGAATVVDLGFLAGWSGDDGARFRR